MLGLIRVMKQWLKGRSSALNPRRSGWLDSETGNEPNDLQERDLRKYGHVHGPSWEWMTKEKHKSPKQVIESAGSVGGQGDRDLRESR